MRRYLIVAAVLAVGSAYAIPTATASAASLKDCGKLTVASGFGGGLPHGVPAGSKPRLDGFRVSGKVKCSIVVHVLNAFEAHASDAEHLSDPPAPGWSPCNFIVGSGYVCRSGDNVILAGVVWLKGGHEVGPKPHAPAPSKDRPSSISVACNFVIATATDSCTATVQDAGSAGRSTPSGFVSWRSAGGGSFTSGNSCTLAPSKVNGVPTVGTASCEVQFKPPATTSSTVTATYIGGPEHLGSQAKSNALVPGNVG